MRIVVIGAGIIGVATADQLASAGAQVTIIDAARPGHGTTATSLGWVNANKTLDLGYFEFRIAAIRIWAQLAAEFGSPRWYVPNGNVTWALDVARDELTARVNRLRERGYPARLVTTSEVAAIEPALRIPSEALSAHFPEEGFAHGTQAAQALTTRAQAAGARLVKDRVASLDHNGEQVKGVRLASGHHIAADAVICALGWRTNEILATADAAVPLVDARMPRSPAPCLVVTTTGPGHLHGIVHSPDVYARPAWHTGLLLEASDLDAAIDMSTTTEQMQAHAVELLNRARRIIPDLATARTAGIHRCIRPLPVDGLPLVGWCRPGLYVAVTHSGITLAPYLARLIRRTILDDVSIEELTDYRPDRVSTDD